MIDKQLHDMQLQMAESLAHSQEKVSRMQEVEATYRAQAAKINANREAEITDASRSTHEKLARQTDNLLRPTAMLRPNVAKVEDGWEASFGEVVGTGPSPELACQDFDRRWLGKDEI